MKAVIIGERERVDINTQVEKVLRGLGNPEPPVKLDQVRELLRLDRQYYSATNDSAVREFVSKLKIGAQQLAMRPTLLIDIIKKANLSALWIPDRQRILIDQDAPVIKHRWNETHEVIHSITEWHKLFLLGDSANELSMACHQTLEAEANYGAGQLLFLRDRFMIEARDLSMNVTTIRELATKFGNTITSTFWRYVEQMGASLPMVGLVTPHPHRLPAGHDLNSPCKYFIESPAFRQQFSTVSEATIFQILPIYCKNASGGCLGEREIVLRDVNGEDHLFWFETFFNRHDALTLAYHLRKRAVVVAFDF